MHSLINSPLITYKTNGLVMGTPRLTTWYCAPSEEWFVTNMHHLVHHLIGTKLQPPCAPWCTMQVSGAHRRSMVHSIVLYPQGGAQCSSHKPALTNRQTCYTCRCSLRLVIVHKDPSVSGDGQTKRMLCCLA